MKIDCARQKDMRIITKGKKKKVITVEKIMYITCEDKLSTIFLEDNSKVYDITSLTDFEEKLSGIGFFRIANNTLINGKYVTEIDGKFVVFGKIRLKVTNNRSKFLKKWLDE